MVELDKIDRVILNRLQEDARKSFREIAKEAGVSEGTIFVRVKKLQESGVIKGFRAVVNPELIGKKVTAFILLKVLPKMYRSVLEELAKLDDVFEIYDVTGACYAILRVYTQNTEQLADLIDKIGTVEGITSTETAVVLRSIKQQSIIKV